VGCSSQADAQGRRVETQARGAQVGGAGVAVRDEARGLDILAARRNYADKLFDCKKLARWNVLPAHPGARARLSRVGA